MGRISPQRSWYGVGHVAHTAPVPDAVKSLIAGFTEIRLNFPSSVTFDAPLSLVHLSRDGELSKSTFWSKCTTFTSGPQVMYLCG